VNGTKVGARRIKSLVQGFRFADIGLSVMKILAASEITLRSRAAAEHGNSGAVSNQGPRDRRANTAGASRNYCVLARQCL
jgi:hypothetical protein